MHWETRYWIVVGSVLVFVLSLVILPVILVFMPADYFTRDWALAAGRTRHPVVRFSVLLLKNVVGFLLFCAGVMMLFTPGQGILGMLAGLWLMDFPGKRTLERRIIRRPGILAAINRLRGAFGRAPLEKPDGLT